MNDLARSGELDALGVATVRTLAIDAVEQAASGHPGTPMALAPAGYVLFMRHLTHNPANPRWFDRDRFILSNGHASMLQYALLHLTGYDLPLEELRRFRQWGSRTPGHPEFGVTPGVEATTGPLGQGFMNAVGMAMAEAHLATRYNRDHIPVVDHRTWVFASDGDMMEGASHEAASLAGHLRLGKLTVLYDDNHITIDGDTRQTFTEEVSRRFEAYGWHVQNLGERAEDLAALDAAFEAARLQADRPSLIILRSHIAFGAPTLQDQAAAHGAPLGADEVRETKRRYGWPEEAQFLVPEAVAEHMRQALARGEREEHAWLKRLEAYRVNYPEAARELERAIAGELPAGWSAEPPVFDPTEHQIATRKAMSRVLNHFAGTIPELMGGAADLASSTQATMPGAGDFVPDSYAGRNIHWGVREHLMCAASSGLALHGGVRPFASTFFIFTDYARPAIRLAALTGLPVIYLLSHDSIALGEDGPTHQPIEHLASFRAMPGMHVVRPADANETVYALMAALQRREGPTIILLTRQKLPVFDRGHARTGAAEGVLRGAYVLAREVNGAPDLLLLASGSEVHLAVAAQGQLATRHNLYARVISMPCWELFRAQPQVYRDEVLPPGVTLRLAVEAGASFGWCEWVGEKGAVIGIDRFGASAPGAENLARFGFSVDHIVQRALALTGR